MLNYIDRVEFLAEIRLSYFAFCHNSAKMGEIIRLGKRQNVCRAPGFYDGVQAPEAP